MRIRIIHLYYFKSTRINVIHTFIMYAYTIVYTERYFPFTLFTTFPNMLLDNSCEQTHKINKLTISKLLRNDKHFHWYSIKYHYINLFNVVYIL
jgi:hypothetical protein